MAAFLTLPKRYAIALARRGMPFINRHPKTMRFVLAITRKLGVYPILRAVHARLVIPSCQSGNGSSDGFMPTEIAHLSPRARHIYAELKAAIEHRQKEGV